MATTKNEKLHLQALKRFEELSNAPDREARKLAINDSLFVHDENGQWEEYARTVRANRPRYTIDRISAALDQIIGNQKQSRISINVIPRKSGSEDVARILKGLIRDIEVESSAQSAYDNAFREISEGGFGGWRVYYDFIDGDSFDQEIGIEPIYSAASSLFFDPYSKKEDRSDANWAFFITEISRDSFKEMWPEAAISEMETPSSLNESKAWFNNEQDSLRIAEYWFKEPVKKEIGLLSDGRVIDLEEEKDVLDELSESGVTVKRSRIVDSHKIFSVIMNGNEFLTKPEEWVGSFIPLVPVFGKTAVIDKKFFSRGIIRKAIDPQRVYNYATSNAVETTALTPKDPIWATRQQAQGEEKDWQEFPTKNQPFLFYTHDEKAPGPPQRGGAPAVQESLLQQVEQAKNDIYATTGIEPASLGNVPQLKSGRAIASEQKMGDRGSFVFRDNLAKGIAYTGRILIDLIPKVYDNERTLRILGEDEVSREVKINETVLDDETGKTVIVNDLSLGKYSVVATIGNSYSTQRVETVDQLTTLAGQSEMIQQLGLDIIVKNMDINSGEELRERIRKVLIKAGVIDPTPEEIKKYGLDQPPAEDPMNVALRQNVEAQTEKILIDAQRTISEVERNDADTQLKIMQTQEKAVDALSKTVDIINQKRSAGLQITAQELEILRGQLVIVEETQGDVIAGSEVAGSVPLGRLV